MFETEIRADALRNISGHNLRGRKLCENTAITFNHFQTRLVSKLISFKSRFTEFNIITRQVSRTYVCRKGQARKSNESEL